MTLNISEAGAVNTLVRHLLGAKPRGVREPPTRKHAVEALAELADAAHKKLGAGFSGDAVRELLPTLWLPPQPFPTSVHWLDDGEENPGKPLLFTTQGAAHGAAVDQYCRANPLSDPDSDEIDWLPPQDEDDAADDRELAVRGRRTGIFVRPVWPKDAA